MSYNRYKPKAAEIDVLRSETNGERKKKNSNYAPTENTTKVISNKKRI